MKPLLSSAKRSGFGFELFAKASHGHARSGVFTTPHGPVETPAFMPVGTYGTVKGVLPRDLFEAGSRMILANAYHLSVRPGEQLVKELGGLHRFMGWSGPILTDSGGYQVFSLADRRNMDEDGVTFRSVVDGTLLRFDPERVMDIEHALGADVIMAFDHCPSNPLDRVEVEGATERTHRWLERCVRAHRERGAEETGSALFGIVQGGAFEDLRKRSVETITAHDLVGYAIGGVSVGEHKNALVQAIEWTAPLLPEDRPRYLMGVGTPGDFFDAVERGVDLFDCVTATRHGRNHSAYTSRGKVNVRGAVWKNRDEPLDPACDCPACTQFPVGSLRHYCTQNEMLGASLVTLHNLHFFHGLMRDMRAAIERDALTELRAARLAPMLGKFSG